MPSVDLIADQISESPSNIDWGNSPKDQLPVSEIHWWWRTETPGWSMHLVELQSLAGTTLTFRGVRLSNVDLSFGPEGDNDPSHYSVDLTNLRHVYPLHPSSLDGYISGSNTRYALLLLSKYYKTGLSKDIDYEYPGETGHDPGDFLQFATGGPKYPPAHESERVKLLEKELAKAKEDRVKAIADADALFAELGVKFNPKVKQWSKTWAL